MVRRTKRTKRRSNRRKQRGGKETSGYYLALDGFPNAPGASRVDSYSTCNAPAFTSGLDNAYMSASSGKTGGRRRKRKSRRSRRKSRRKSRRSNARWLPVITRSRLCTHPVATKEPSTQLPR